MKKYYCLLRSIIGLLTGLSTAGGFAQTTITGRVTDGLKKPLSGSSILLLNLRDSALVQGALSKSDGSYRLNQVASGNYLLGFSFLGYEARYASIEVGNEQKKELGDVMLSPVAAHLREVTVMAHKPMFEQKTDRMVVNVKNSITNAGGTVLDVLQKSPGIMVNRAAGTITMSGKDGVQVMINGKMSYMPADALISMLEGMSSNNVERIELITTPPAKFDAGGNAGYINIVLQQNPNQGFNSNISLTIAAFYGTAPAGNFDFNYRQKKSNLYGGYGISRTAQKQRLDSYDKSTLQKGIFENRFVTLRDPYRFNNTLRLGYDYELNKRTILGILVSGYDSKWNMNARNQSDIFMNGALDTAIAIDNHEINHWKHAMANFNIQHRPDSLSEVSFNADYLVYDDSNPSEYMNNYFDGSNGFLFSKEQKSTKKTIFTLFPVQLDYKRKIDNKLDLEAGLKTVLTGFTNDVLVAWLEPAGWKSDPKYTGRYDMDERIMAAYISTTLQADEKNKLQAGLRYEHTFSHLHTETGKDITNKKYGGFFPTIYWSRKVSGNSSFTLSYNRRIDRPKFDQLAPFLIFGGPNSLVTGNPALKPSISDAIKFDYALKHLVFSIGYTTEKDFISIFQPTIDTVLNKRYITAQNIPYKNTVYTSLILPVTITKWWTSFFSLTASWVKAKADYVGYPVTLEAFNGALSGAQNFKIGNSYSLEMSGFYTTKSISGIALLKPIGMLNIAAQKKFKRPGTALTLGVDDVFSSMKFRASVDLPKQKSSGWGIAHMTNRLFKLTFTYRFGNAILKDKRVRNTASEQEQQRLGN